MKVVLEASNICKSFGKVQALKKGNIKTYEGQTTVLLGENGAGKSTLMNVISGQFLPTSGDIFFRGQKVQVTKIKQAKKIGIAIVHQEIKLVQHMNVAENIFLGREPLNKLKLVDYKKMHHDTKVLLSHWDVAFNSYSQVENLSIAQQQLIEIIKAISLNAKLVIFDEPTSSLGDEETKLLFEIIASLKKEGVSILYITHRMEEIALLADHVAIFRDGEFVDQFPVAEFELDNAIEKMVGRKITDKFPIKLSSKVKPFLKIKNFSNQFVNDVNLEINKGEILVIAGLVGAGRSELFKSMVGLMPYKSGSILVNDNYVKNFSNSNALKNGFYYVSEDRKTEGLVLEKSIDFNVTLSSLKKIMHRKIPLLNLKKEEIETAKYIRSVNIKTPSGKELVKNLSGGNQQKVAISKALMANPSVFIFDEPTRGVDVGARKEIYAIFEKLKTEDKAIVVISSDLQEVVGLADRVVVINRKGRISGILNKENIVGEKILKLAFTEKGMHENN